MICNGRTLARLFEGAALEDFVCFTFRLCIWFLFVSMPRCPLFGCPCTAQLTLGRHEYIGCLSTVRIGVLMQASGGLSRARCLDNGEAANVGEGTFPGHSVKGLFNVVTHPPRYRDIGQRNLPPT